MGVGVLAPTALDSRSLIVGYDKKLRIKSLPDDIYTDLGGLYNTEKQSVPNAIYMEVNKAALEGSNTTVITMKKPLQAAAVYGNAVAIGNEERPVTKSMTLYRNNLRKVVTTPGYGTRALDAAAYKLYEQHIDDLSGWNSEQEGLEIRQAFMERFGRDKPRSVQLGVMVEVPSLLFALDALAREVDFMSVGSNDLLQFLFAADRDHPQMAGRYDACNPAAIRALRMIVEAADRAQIPVSVCGELAGRPVDALMLMALGYRHLSMSPLSVGPIKAMELDLDLGALQQRVAQALEASETEATIRPALEQWAHQHGLL
jgi:hypothetical protein